MPGEAFIPTEQRTALSYLMKPVSDHLGARVSRGTKIPCSFPVIPCSGRKNSLFLRVGNLAASALY
jgi:hypothetical protein